jgi:hypothetical protein
LFAFSLANPTFDLESRHPPEFGAIVGDEGQVLVQRVHGYQKIKLTNP